MDIINKVASSGLVTLDLEEYYNGGVNNGENIQIYI